MRRIICWLFGHRSDVSVALPDSDEEELRALSVRDPEYLDYLIDTAHPVGIVICRRCGTTEIGPL